MDRKMQNVNFTKYLLLPLANFTCTSEVTNKSIKVDENSYSYKALESNKFMIWKYIPIIFLFMLVTRYELLNNHLEIFVSLVLVGLAIASNIKYSNIQSFLFFLIATLTYVFLSKDVLLLPMIYKYSLIFYVLIQLVLDLKVRKYYEVYNDENQLVSYCYIEKDKV